MRCVVSIRKERRIIYVPGKIGNPVDLKRAEEEVKKIGGRVVFCVADDMPILGGLSYEG